MGAINIKVILLIAGVFFAGVLVRGEFARRQDMARELKEIKDSQTKIQAQVDSINFAYAVQKLQLAQRTDSLYTQLDEIIRLKTLNARTIRDLQENINDQRKQLSFEIHDLKGVISQYPVGVKSAN